jgi:hypothetical protein
MMTHQGIRRPVIKIAIDKRARESENRWHEDGWAWSFSRRWFDRRLSDRCLSDSVRVRAEEAGYSGSDAASDTKPGASRHGRDR